MVGRRSYQEMEKGEGTGIYNCSASGKIVSRISSFRARSWGVAIAIGRVYNLDVVDVPFPAGA